MVMIVMMKTVVRLKAGKIILNAITTMIAMTIMVTFRLVGIRRISAIVVMVIRIAGRYTNNSKQ